MIQKHVNELCREHSERIAFYAVDVRGTCGCLFVDLKAHSYTSKVHYLRFRAFFHPVTYHRHQCENGFRVAGTIYTSNSLFWWAELPESKRWQRCTTWIVLSESWGKELNITSLEVAHTILSADTILWPSSVLSSLSVVFLNMIATPGQEALSVPWSSLPKRTSKLFFALRCKFLLSSSPVSHVFVW